MRNVDRTVKDLQLQIDRRDKTNAQLQDDISRSRDKIEKLLGTIEELQSSESANQLTARRAERELREEKEKALRLERELEGWKGLRLGKDNRIKASGSWRPHSPWNEESAASIPESPGGVVVPTRKSSISRTTSLSKGFL